MTGTENEKELHTSSIAPDCSNEVLWAVVGLLLLEGAVDIRHFERRAVLIRKALGLGKDRFESIRKLLLKKGFIAKQRRGGKEFITLGKASLDGMEREGGERAGKKDGSPKSLYLLLDAIACVPALLVRGGFSTVDLLSKEHFSEVRDLIRNHDLSMEAVESILREGANIRRENGSGFICRGYLPDFPRFFPWEMRERTLKMGGSNKEILGQIYFIISISGKVDRKEPITRDDIARIFGIVDGRYYVLKDRTVKDAYPRKYLDSRLKTLERRELIERVNSPGGKSYRTTDKKIYIPKGIEDEVSAVMHWRARAGNGS